MANTYYDKWSTILFEYKGYDGTVDEFCKLYNIGKSSLYKALKEFRDNDIKIEGIKVIEIKPKMLDIINISVNGYNLSFDKNIDISSLSKVMKAIL